MMTRSPPVTGDKASVTGAPSAVMVKAPAGAQAANEVVEELVEDERNFGAGGRDGGAHEHGSQGVGGLGVVGDGEVGEGGGVEPVGVLDGVGVVARAGVGVGDRDVLARQDVGVERGEDDGVGVARRDGGAADGDGAAPGR